MVWEYKTEKGNKSIGKGGINEVERGQGGGGGVGMEGGW